MGSEGQGRARERGGGRGEPWDGVWLQPPVPGCRLGTPAHLGQERAQRGLARAAACTAPAWGWPSCCFQESALPTPANTEAAGAGGTPRAIACTPHRCLGMCWQWALHPTRPIAYQCPWWDWLCCPRRDLLALHRGARQLLAWQFCFQKADLGENTSYGASFETDHQGCGLSCSQVLQPFLPGEGTVVGSGICLKKLGNQAGRH